MCVNIGYKDVNDTEHHFSCELSHNTGEGLGLTVLYQKTYL